MSGLNNFYKDTGDRILGMLQKELRILSDETRFLTKDVHTRSSTGSKIIYLSFGSLDRGPRMDEDNFSEIEFDSIRDEYLKKNDHFITKAKDLIKAELAPFDCMVDAELDYGEKGHITLEIQLTIQGRFYKDQNGNDLWADFEGLYDPDSIMLMTPDIERYFETPEAVEKFAQGFSFQEQPSDLPF